MRCELCPANGTTVCKLHYLISCFTCSAVAIAFVLDVDIVVTLMEQIPLFSSPTISRQSSQITSVGLISLSLLQKYFTFPGGSYGHCSIAITSAVSGVRSSVLRHVPGWMGSLRPLFISATGVKWKSFLKFLRNHHEILFLLNCSTFLTLFNSVRFLSYYVT